MFDDLFSDITRDIRGESKPEVKEPEVSNEDWDNGVFSNKGEMFDNTNDGYNWRN